MLFAAVMSLAVLIIGGNYLHSHIHKHESQAAHQQCPVYQLQAQAFTAIGIVLGVLFSIILFKDIAGHPQDFIIQPNYILSESHAPPALLS